MNTSWICALLLVGTTMAVLVAQGSARSVDVGEFDERVEGWERTFGAEDHDSLEGVVDATPLDRYFGSKGQGCVKENTRPIVRWTQFKLLTTETANDCLVKCERGYSTCKAFYYQGPTKDCRLYLKFDKHFTGAITKPEAGSVVGNKYDNNGC